MRRGIRILWCLRLHYHGRRGEVSLLVKTRTRVLLGGHLRGRGATAALGLAVVESLDGRDLAAKHLIRGTVRLRLLGSISRVLVHRLFDRRLGEIVCYLALVAVEVAALTIHTVVGIVAEDVVSLVIGEVITTTALILLTTASGLLECILSSALTTKVGLVTVLVAEHAPSRLLECLALPLKVVVAATTTE